MAIDNQVRSITPTAAGDPDYQRRWWILAVLAIAQLMVILDASVINIALPSCRPTGASLLQRQSAVGHLGLRTGIRKSSPRRWSDR